MPRYKFQVNNTEDVTVNAPTLEDALQQAGIEEYDSYTIIEGDDKRDDFEDCCFLSAITDDILFGE